MLGRLKAHLPWWAKMGAKIVLSRVPFAYDVWHRIGVFRHGRMDSGDYALSVFESHLQRAGLKKEDLCGKVIVEIGPGDSVATAVIAVAFGAKAILVDAGRFAKEDLSLYCELSMRLSERGGNSIDLASVSSLDELLRTVGAQYLTSGGLDVWRQIPDQSVDFIFSQAVLEHVRKRDFVQIQRECRRILKPDGVASHRVDLRDHLGGALNSLRFSEKIWESEFFARSGFYTNRIRMSSMAKIFEDAGFEVVFGDIRRWGSLPTPRKKLDDEFRGLTDSELCVSGFDVVLRPL